MTIAGKRAERLRSTDRVVLGFAFGVFVFGVTFGVLARASGLSIVQAITMSASVYAAAAQFTLVASASAGAPLLVACIAGVFVNLRMIPLGIAVAPGLSRSRWTRLAESYLIVDESVAVASGSHGVVDRKKFVEAGLWLLAAWVGGTTVGSIGAVGVGDPATFGLDAAFPAGFLALLGGRLREDPRARSVALLGALSALLLTPFVPVGVAPVVAACAALVALVKRD